MLGPTIVYVIVLRKRKSGTVNLVISIVDRGHHKITLPVLYSSYFFM